MMKIYFTFKMNLFSRKHGKLYTDVYSQFVYDIIFLKEIITAIYKTTSGALYCKYV